MYTVPHTVRDDEGHLLAAAGTPMSQTDAREKGVIAAVKKHRDARKAKQEAARETAKADTAPPVAAAPVEVDTKTEVASTRKGAK